MVAGFTVLVHDRDPGDNLGGTASMRAVVQRVSRASVRVDGAIVGVIEQGLCVLVSAGRDDTAADTAWMATKLAGLRVFADDEDKMNLDVVQVGGGLLLVSQFTLHGDVRKGKRPAFGHAMAPELAAPMLDDLQAALRKLQVPVATGRFGAMMQVELVNDGPVTILLDSKKTF